MKKIISVFICILCLFFAVGCTSNSAENTSDITIDELKEKYPEYFNVSDFKGLELYVWALSENDYRCGLMQGTNRTKTKDEIISLPQATPDEMKKILSTYSTSDSDIFLITFENPLSNYHFELDDAYCEKISKLFDDKYRVFTIDLD